MEETYCGTELKRCFTEDFKHENGEYMNTCVVCKNNFIGYKRRVVCKLCMEVEVI